MSFSYTFPTLLDGENKTCILRNKIRKNYQHAKKWAKRTQTNAFRIYDREIKEYPVVIDFYAGKFYVQFFSTPILDKISRQKDIFSMRFDRKLNEVCEGGSQSATSEPIFCRRSRKDDLLPRYPIQNWRSTSDLYDKVLEALQALFGAAEEDIYSRTRIKRKKIEQYEKIDSSQEFFSVFEHGVEFKVNLLDYLDTGLFLDHRDTRQLVAHASRGKRLLNLFAYTCSFSVHAAKQGAAYTKSVDMSNTYTAWGRENFNLNALPHESNPIVRADCLKFLEEETEKYDVIVIDPPTLSRSKKMDQLFDIQEEYKSLIIKALKLLLPQGQIFFSTNFRKFSFESAFFNHCQIRDISEKTLPFDFHRQKTHFCWQISLTGSNS